MESAENSGLRSSKPPAGQKKFRGFFLQFGSCRRNKTPARGKSHYSFPHHIIIQIGISITTAPNSCTIRNLSHNK